MSDISESASVSVNRRGFIGRAGATAAAGIAAAGSVGQAAAAVGGKGLRSFTGKYVIDGHRIIDGFIAAPRGKSGLDVVLVVSENGALDSSAEATARDYAARGWFAFAPDLTRTYRGAALAGKADMVEALMRDLPRFKRLARGSGKVAVVAA